MGSRMSRTKTGPGVCRATSKSFLDDQVSAGTRTFMLGSVVMLAMSSVAWWVTPSMAGVKPPCDERNLTLRFG